MRPGGFIDGIQTDMLYGQLLDGATVLSGTGVVGADGWPVGVTKPLHWWYGPGLVSSHNDGAASGPLNLTAGGSPTFGVNWANQANLGLVTSAGNYAYYNGTSADINQLGATFSVILEFISPTHPVVDVVFGIDIGTYLASGVEILMPRSADPRVLFSTNKSGLSSLVGSPNLTANRKYQIIFTLSGGNGTVCVNGVSGSPTALYTPDDSSTKLTIGALADSLVYPFTGTIFRFGILKGTAWTPTEIAALYNAWVPVNEANTYARWYGATPTVSKVVNGVTTSPAAGTWGAETAGQYGYAAYALRYHNLVPGDALGSPGNWR